MSGMAIFSGKVGSDLCVAMVHGGAVMVSLPLRWLRVVGMSAPRVVTISSLLLVATDYCWEVLRSP